MMLFSKRSWVGWCSIFLWVLGCVACAGTQPARVPVNVSTRTTNASASPLVGPQVAPDPRPTGAAPPVGHTAYYQDDGPGDNPPVDLDSIPDAELKIEPLLRGPNKPYVVFGIEYQPDLSDKPYKQRGIASWYGRKFHGQKTSSGEIYDMYAMTAAHPTLPLPSYARVSNPNNGKQVIVRVNDRGPFLHNRIMDLSYAAAHRLGIAQRGSGEVEVEHLRTEEIRQLLALRSPTTAPADLSVVANSVAVAINTNTPPAGLVKPLPTVQTGQGIWLQLGAFTSSEAADTFRAHVYRMLEWLNEPIELVSTNQANQGMVRLHLGPYPDRATAQRVADQIRASLNLKPMLLERNIVSSNN